MFRITLFVCILGEVNILYIFCFIFGDLQTFRHYNIKKKMPLKTWKTNPPSKVAHNRPNFLQYCLPVHNQPKSQFLFHKNCSACSLCIMTLTIEQNIKRPAAFKSHQSKYQESCKKVCMSNNIDYSTKLCMYMYCKLAQICMSCIKPFLLDPSTS